MALLRRWQSYVGEQVRQIVLDAADQSLGSVAIVIAIVAIAQSYEKRKEVLFGSEQLLTIITRWELEARWPYTAREASAVWNVVNCNRRLKSAAKAAKFMLRQ